MLAPQTETSCIRDPEEALAILSIRLPGDIESRLERLARETGCTKSHFARAAIIEKIEDMEDIYLAEEVLDCIRNGDERTGAFRF